MTELRKPSRGAVKPGGVPQVPSVKVPTPALVLVSDLVCDGCKWPERCRRDKLCWSAEKAAIAEERLR